MSVDRGVIVIDAEGDQVEFYVRALDVKIEAMREIVGYFKELAPGFYKDFYGSDEGFSHTLLEPEEVLADECDFFTFLDTRPTFTLLLRFRSNKPKDLSLFFSSLARLEHRLPIGEN